MTVLREFMIDCFGRSGKDFFFLTLYRLCFHLVGFLTDVYQLGQNIRQGNVDNAVNLATKLSKNHVRLQTNIRKEQNEENPKPYVKTSLFLIKLFIL